MIKRIYLAAAYQRHDEMCGVRDVLQALDYLVTSRWIDQHGGDQPEAAVGEALKVDDPAHAQFIAEDLEDIDRADTLISFTGTGTTGGRHVEFGYALAMGKRLILVGPRENIFHRYEHVEHYETWPRLVMALTPARLMGQK